MAMPSDGKSIVATPKSCARINCVAASPAGTPIMTPTSATRTASPRTILVTSPGSAPSAARNPNSLVRCLVEYDVSPYSPSAESTRLAMQKNTVTCTSSTSSDTVSRTRSFTGSTDRQRPIDVLDRTTNRTHEPRGIPAHVHREFGLSRVAGVRVVEHDVHLASRLAADVTALKIPHDPDDPVVQGVVQRHSTAERITSTEILLRHRFVDHHGGWSRLEILAVDVAAANHTRANGVEKVRADLIE